MSEEPLRYVSPGSGEEFEREDLNPRSIFIFLLGLGILCILSAFLVVGMYRYLDAYQRAHQPPANPLVTPKVEKTRPTYAETRKEIRETFPEPRLEDDERTQLNSVLNPQEEQLNSYGWVDEKTGVVHIPIDRAMALIAQRGLPVLPQGSASQPAGGGKPAAKSAAMAHPSPATAAGEEAKQ